MEYRGHASASRADSESSPRPMIPTHIVATKVKKSRCVITFIIQYSIIIDTDRVDALRSSFAAYLCCVVLKKQGNHTSVNSDIAVMHKHDVPTPVW